MPYVFENSATPQYGFVFEDEMPQGFVFEDEQPEKPSAMKTIGRDALRTVENVGQVYPVAETAVNVASMTYGLPISGLAGLATLPFGLERAGKVQEWVANTLIYSPQTQRGQELTRAAFYPFEKLEEIGEKGGELVAEKTGKPILKPIVKTGIQALPLALPMIKRAAKKRYQITPVEEAGKLTPESEWLKGQVKERYVEPEAPKGIDLIRQAAEKRQAEIERVMPEGAPGTKLYGGIPADIMQKVWTKTVGEPVWDKLIMKHLPKALEKVPGGKAINRAFIYDYRGNLPNTETYITSMDAMKRHQAIGREYGIDLGKRLQQFPDEAQLRMGEVIRGEKARLSPKEAKITMEAKQVLYDLGRQAVDLGLLKEEAFFKNAGRYMPRLYTSKEYQTLLTHYNLTKPNRLDLSRFKRRQDIPKEVRQQMGEILTPGYPVAKGIAQLTHDIEMARWFKGIASNPEWSVPKTTKTAVPKGFKQLPSNNKLGPISESYVHPEIFADLQEAVRVMELPERVWRKALGTWKFGKVIISPKTHVRNLMSNSLLAHLGGMPMYEQPVYLVKAAREMRSQGKYWKAAMENDLLRQTFTNAELRELFDQVEGQMSGIKAASIPERLGIIGNSWAQLRKGAGKAAKLYEAEEQWFKMGKFIHNVERKGMDFKAAALDAEKWLFNYSKVTRFQAKYRTRWYGAPFATFTFKALPRVMEAAVKTPWRFALPAAIIYGLEKAAQKKAGDTKEEAEAKRALRPEYQKGNFLGMPNFARVPIVDDFGREYYLNLTYITPWGDIGEGGGFGPIPGGIMPFSQPFIKEPTQLISNWDWFWQDQIVKEEDVAGKKPVDRYLTIAKIAGKHIGQALSPTPGLDIVKGIAALRGKPDYRGRERPKKVVAADVFLGVKMYPVDYAEQAQRVISKNHPKKGALARKIRSQIRTLHIRKKALQDRGRDVSHYDKLIEGKIAQLHGLAREARKTGTLYRESGLAEKAKKSFEKRYKPILIKPAGQNNG